MATFGSPFSSSVCLLLAGSGPTPVSNINNHLTAGVDPYRSFALGCKSPLNQQDWTITSCDLNWNFRFFAVTQQYTKSINARSRKYHRVVAEVAVAAGLVRLATIKTKNQSIKSTGIKPDRGRATVETTNTQW